jgi:hypothetical protein
LANAFEELEERYPEVKDLATSAQLTEATLLLQQEIKGVNSGLHSDVLEMEIRLRKDMNRQTYILIAVLPVVISLISFISRRVL